MDQQKSISQSSNRQEKTIRASSFQWIGVQKNRAICRDNAKPEPAAKHPRVSSLEGVLLLKTGKL
jgi:hypothetical protein